jgi:hypothetical protein
LLPCSFSNFATALSAGGQLEQPSEVNNSTTANPLSLVEDEFFAERSLQVNEVIIKDTAIKTGIIFIDDRL